MFTDAGVVTGALSNDDIRLRSIHGHTQFVAPGYNERVLEQAGFRLLHHDDRTASLRRNAAGRIAARLAHRSELERVEGPSDFGRERQYLGEVVELARRGGLSRILYVVESAKPQ